MWLNIGLSYKVREKFVFWLFFKIDLCSAISFKRSRRELSIDVAEQRSILKKNVLPPFDFHTLIRYKNSLKKGVWV